MTDRPPLALSRLLDGLIDYAGLFPPAGLPMADVVQRFARYRRSPAAWALGRIVIPMSRIDEFEREASRLDEGGGPPAGRWPLSVIGSLPLEADLARVEAFNAAHRGQDAALAAVIESVEVKASSAIEIVRAGETAPPDLALFFEIPLNAGIDDLCDAAASVRHGLKLRTGGLTLDGFPPSAVVAQFLASAVA
jgi:hypothetical protein